MDHDSQFAQYRPAEKCSASHEETLPLLPSQPYSVQVKRESLLFIGTYFSNLYTAVDTPARGRVGGTHCKRTSLWRSESAESAKVHSASKVRKTHFVLNVK